MLSSHYKGGITYNLLEAERGAGMSQRTRRPYLWRVLEKDATWFEGIRDEDAFACVMAVGEEGKGETWRDEHQGGGRTSRATQHSEVHWGPGVEEGETTIGLEARQAGHLHHQTYRSNSKARSRARVPWPKPVT